MWAFNDRLRNDYNFQELVHWLFPSKMQQLFVISIDNLVILACFLLIILCVPIIATKQKPNN